MNERTASVVTRFEGRVAVVTGAGMGIGREVALRLASEGSAVAILDKNTGSAEEVAQEVQTLGSDATALACDVTDEDQVREALAAVMERFQRLDVLVNNAGAVFRGTCVETTLEDWNRTIATNLTGAFLASKHTLPHMVAGGGGAIVNISALSGLVGVGARAAYMSAKAGVLGLTRSITYDYARDGVRCNAVCPATTRTPLVEGIAQTYDDPSAFLQHVSERQFVGRMAEPSEIAAAIVFLASSDASYLFGIYLPVDGGLTATTPRDR